MATFKLDDPIAGTLGGGQYRTIPFRMMGEFRDLQLRWYQSVADQDMEPHYLELFMSSVGVDESLPA
jgi:hypothetical protein